MSDPSPTIVQIHRPLNLTPNDDNNVNNPNHHNNLNNNNNFPMYEQPKEQRVPVCFFEWKNPSQRGEMGVSVRSIALGQLQGLGGVGGGALIAASGVAVGTSLAALGSGSAVLAAGFGMKIITDAISLASFSIKAGSLALATVVAAPLTVGGVVAGGKIILLAGGGCGVAYLCGGTGVDVVNFSVDLLFDSIKFGAKLSKESLKLGYEMSKTGSKSIGHSSYYALNSLIQTILRGLSQQQKQKEEKESPKRPEYEQTFEEVEGQEFVNITRKPTIDLDDFLDDCVEM